MAQGYAQFAAVLNDEDLPGSALATLRRGGSAHVMMDGPRSAQWGSDGWRVWDRQHDAHDGTTPCKGHAGSAIFPALIAMAQADAGLDDC